MGLFEVYDLLDIEPVEAKGAYLWDKQGGKYLDFYGGQDVYKRQGKSRFSI